MAIAQGTGTAGNSITDGVLLFGMDTNQTGLSAGSTYYAGNTAGAIVSTPGTVEVTIGQANTTTDLYFSPRYNQQLTENQLDGLDNSLGGALSAVNPVVTSGDVSNAGVADKIVRLSGTSYPAGDGSAITGVDFKTESYTASGAINQNDSVYVTAANTVKSLYPSAMGTGSAISTGPSHVLTTKSLPLSVNGTYLNISGGYFNGSGVLYAQMRTINAGETDFSNNTEYTVYGTGNGTRVFDVCSIGTDKFLFVFQADTGGAAAGIKAVVATVSGGVVTVGSAVTVETTGALTSSVSCAKVDTDKGIIFYKDDAGNDLYMKVLSVSGTTITQNTQALVKAMSHVYDVSSVQLGTNSIAVTYSPSGTSLFGSVITVSGTTPTAGAEQTVIAASEGYKHKITLINASKLLLTYNEDFTNASYARTIAISGSTMTASSALTLESSIDQYAWGTSIIGTKYALVFARDTTTDNTLYFLDISGTLPSSISTQSLATSPETSQYATCVVKVSPWTYMVTGALVDSDYIVKLTAPSSARIGVAQSSISDTASGVIMLRYKTQTLSGITLTPGSFYYTDDTGQPTINSSLTAPTLGIAISTTKILLQ